MLTTLRAALSVLFLVGFYVLALVLLGGLGVLAVKALEGGATTIGAKLVWLVGAAAVGIGVVVWRVVRAEPEPEPGVVLSRTDAPELWDEVERLAQAAQTRVPDEIRLVPEVNAAVAEDARQLGLVSGTRRLYLGVPLLLGLDVARLRSVLAHELGHYSHNHTRIGPLVYRGRTAILATGEHLRGNLVGVVLRMYGRLYLLVSAGTARRQELEADALSVRIAGRTVAQDALREVPVIDDAWAFYEGAYLQGGWEVGLAPTAENFFSGFAELLAARQDELAERRADAPPSDGSVWDSHPSIAARIAVIERMPDVDVEPDRRPATALIPGLPAFATRLAEEVVAFGDRRRVGWSELTGTALARHEQLAADVVFRAAARVEGRSPVTAGGVLDLVARGQGDALLRQLAIDPTQAEPDAPLGAELGAEPDVAADGPTLTPLAAVLRPVLSSAVVATGAGVWRHSWSGPADLVTAGGELIDLDALAGQTAEPAQLPLVRERLAGLGVDLEQARQVGERDTGQGAQLLGALANVDVDGAQHDVVLLDLGLVLVPALTKKKEGGTARLAQLVSSGSPSELAAAHRYVPFEEVAGATIRKRLPIRAELRLHDGQVIDLRSALTGETLDKNCLDVYLGMLADLEARSAVLG